MADYRLEASWSPVEGSFGRFTFTLFNLSAEPLSGFTLACTSLTRVADEHVAEGATLSGALQIFTNILRPRVSASSRAAAGGSQWKG